MRTIENDAIRSQTKTMILLHIKYTYVANNYIHTNIPKHTSIHVKVYVVKQIYLHTPYVSKHPKNP